MVSISKKNDETPEDTFQRIQSLVDSCLLTAEDDLEHHGEDVEEDEIMSPTLENLITCLWPFIHHYLNLSNWNMEPTWKIALLPQLEKKSLAPYLNYFQNSMTVKALLKSNKHHRTIQTIVSDKMVQAISGLVLTTTTDSNDPFK